MNVLGWTGVAARRMRGVTGRSARQDFGVPPGPAGMPVLGMLPALRRDSIQVLDLAMREHGDIVNLPVPGRSRLYALNHPDLIRHVLYDNYANYARTPLHDRLIPVPGKGGMLHSEGE